MNIFLQQLITGISIGSIYALLAVGYALVFSVFNFSNFGFGATMMFGAFAAYYAILRFHFPLLAAVAVGMIAAGAVSMLFELTIYRPMRKKNVMRVYLMIAGLGINIFIPNFMLQIVGAGVKGFPSDWAKATFTFGTVNVTRADMVALVMSMILLGLLWLFLYKTKVGLGIRASSYDTRTAALMGINVSVVASAIFLLSGASAGLAGCFYGMKYSVYPAMGSVATKGFIASTVGGLGSLGGAVVSGLLLGLLETFIASYVSTTYRDLFAYGLLVIVLIFAPNGILGKRVYDKI